MKKGALKLAAIDAAMRQRDYIASGGSYHYSPGVPGIPGEVTRPDESTGNGGGVVLHVPAEHPRAGAPKHVIAAEKARLTEILAEEFDNIRTTVDAVFRPWETIPVTGDFEQIEIDCSRLVASIMGAVTQSASVMTGSGDLGSLIETLKSGETYIWGGAFDSFKTRYINDTANRATNLTALAEVLGQAVAAEKEVWSKVEVDLGAIAEEYTKQFKKVADGGGGNSSVAFAVVGAALAGIALFASGIGATIVAGVGIGLNLAKEMVGEPGPSEDSQSFSDVTSGLSALSAALDALSDRVHDEESQISTGLETIDRNVRNNSDLFQLKAAPIDQSEPQEIGVETGAISIATSKLPAVSSGVLEVTNKPKLIAADLRIALDRNYNAGMSTTGAAPAVEEIAYLLKTLLDELVFDLDNGARLLKRAIDEWDDNEANSVRVIEGYVAEISQTHNGQPADNMFDAPGTNNEGHRKLDIWEMMGGADPSQDKKKGPVL